MFPSMDPKQLQKLMNQMGIKSNELKAKRVVIEKEEGGLVVVDALSVIEIDMKGQKSFQVSGKVSEVEGGAGGEEDLKIIMEQTGASKEEARNALEECKGDLAEAIMKLKK